MSWTMKRFNLCRDPASCATVIMAVRKLKRHPVSISAEIPLPVPLVSNCCTFASVDPFQSLPRCRFLCHRGGCRHWQRWHQGFNLCRDPASCATPSIYLRRWCRGRCFNLCRDPASCATYAAAVLGFGLSGFQSLPRSCSLSHADGGLRTPKSGGCFNLCRDPAP